MNTTPSFLVLATLSFPAPLLAQGAPLLDLSSPFGAGAGVIGDVDGDGTSDLAVRLVGWAGPSGLGILSGADGTLLAQAEVSIGSGGMSGPIVALGDIDGDSVPDLAVAEENPNYRVWALSGSDLRRIHTWQGEPGTLFGQALASVGDLDGDGVGDLAMGAPLAGVGGEVVVVSGQGGGTLFTWSGTPDSQAGISLSSVGDVNGDSVPDVLVGASVAGTPGFRPGSVHVISGADGSEVLSVLGTQAWSEYGWDVAGLGDVNGDGVPDFAASAQAFSWEDCCSLEGGVFVTSGADGSLLYSIEGGVGFGLFGSSVAAVGDLNGDGLGEIAVGSRQTDAAGKWVEIFSGVDGRYLHAVLGDELQGGQFESDSPSLSAAGDWDGDGVVDLIAQEPLSGLVILPGLPVQGETYCSPAVPNSTGLPARLQVHGSPSVDSNRLVLSSDQLPPERVGIFLVGDARTELPGFGSSVGTLCVAGNLGRYSQTPTWSGRAGRASLDVDLGSLPTFPATVVQPGQTWNFQLWYRDAGSTNFSDAVSVTFE